MEFVSKVKTVGKTIVKDKRFWALVAVALAGFGTGVLPVEAVTTVGCALVGGCL